MPKVVIPSPSKAPVIVDGVVEVSVSAACRAGSLSAPDGAISVVVDATGSVQLIIGGKEVCRGVADPDALREGIERLSRRAAANAEVGAIHASDSHPPSYLESASAVCRSGRGRRWRWYCTAKSAKAGIPSVLALVETALASVLIYFSAAFLGFPILTFAAAVAPFFLIDGRDRWGLAKPMKRWLHPAKSSGWSTALAKEMVGLTLIAPAVRSWASAMNLVAAPTWSLRSVPSNWWINVVCRDSFHPHLWPRLTAFHRADTPKFLARAWWALPLAIMPSLFVGLLRLACHWFLKGCAVVYLPFVWLVGHTWSRYGFLDGLWATGSKGIAAGAARAAATLTIALVGSKLLLSNVWRDVSAWFAGQPLELVEHLLAPASIPLWQLAAFANSILAWVVWFAADHYLRRCQAIGAYPAKAVESAFSAVAILRGCLSVYAIAAVLSLIADFH